MAATRSLGEIARSAGACKLHRPGLDSHRMGTTAPVNGKMRQA